MSEIWYSGVGAAERIKELHELVGQITSAWAGVEDGLFEFFLIALAGKRVGDDVRVYRAVFFTFSSFEGKMRLTESAMKVRYEANKSVLSEWSRLKSAANNFSHLRNQIAHLVPSARPSLDPTATANVRLVPPFWKSAFQENDFEKLGYSFEELWQSLRPYWGYHPRISQATPAGEEAYQLSYRLQQFALKLSLPSVAPNNAANR